MAVWLLCAAMAGLYALTLAIPGRAGLLRALGARSRAVGVRGRGRRRARRLPARLAPSPGSRSSPRRPARGPPDGGRARRSDAPRRSHAVRRCIHERAPDGPRRDVSRARAVRRRRAHAHRRRDDLRGAAQRRRAHHRGGARAPRGRAWDAAPLPPAPVHAPHRRPDLADLGARRGVRHRQPRARGGAARAGRRPELLDCSATSTRTAWTAATPSGDRAGARPRPWALGARHQDAPLQVDGVGSVEAGHLLLDTEPEPHDGRLVAEAPEPVEEDLAHRLGFRSRVVVEGARARLETVRHPGRLLELVERARGWPS